MSHIPVFCCPKCGAVADIHYVSQTTQADVDAAQENIDWITEKIAEDAWWSMDLGEARIRRAQIIQRLHGPWLDATCPRCTHNWRDKPLDTRDMGTPIYDGLVSG